MLDYKITKMKKQYIYLLFAAALFVASCKKSYLVQTPPTSVPVASSIKTENDMDDAVNGMYSTMRQFTLFGRDIPILGDLMSDNIYIAQANSGRYLAENNFTMIATNAEASDIYTQGYFTILQANRIISTPLASSNNVNQLKGEAYISRALVYLELVNFFGQPLSVDPNALGVPLITAPTNPSAALTAKPARAKVSAIYAQIISDLDSAYTIMPTTGTTLHGNNSEYLSKYAAKAIESRAYLYKGDYANAVTAALLVVQNGGYTLTASTSLVAYWANPASVSTKVETIFELALNTATNNGFNGLDAFYTQTGGGYGDALVTPDLFNLYSATDARRSLILTPSPLHGAVYYSIKYPNFTLASDKDDIKIIRYAEVLATLAESYARTGNEPNALIYLNTLAKKRDPSFVGYASTGAQLITDILNERRKELAFEGLRYFDLTRLNLPIARPQLGAASAPSIALIPVGDTRRILPIPQAEIDANSSTTQNPGY
jgi:tetratricopeptide (TPR) repeat protein